MPARDQQHRHLDAGQRPRMVARPPVGNLGVGLLQRAAEVLARLAEHVAERQPVVAQPREAAEHLQPGQRLLLHGHHRMPGGHRLEREAAAVGGAVELRRRHRRHDRAEPVAVRDGPLREPEVAGAGHSDRSLVPRLLRDPLERGEAVLALVERGELAARAERAARALDQHLQAALRVQEPVEQPVAAATAVRRPHEHGRHRRRVPGRVEVGQQLGAVGHRHAQVALHPHPGALGGGQPHGAPEQIRVSAQDPERAQVRRPAHTAASSSSRPERMPSRSTWRSGTVE